MLNFFGSSGKPKPAPAQSNNVATAATATTSTSRSTSASASSSTSSAPPPRKKPKTSPAPGVVVTTTRRLVRPPPATASPAVPANRDSIESISGYRPINALSEDKRRRILEDRHAAELEKRRAYEAANPPTKPKRTSSSAASRDRSKQSSRAPSVASDRPTAKSRKKKRTAVFSSSDDDDDDDLDFGSSARRGSARGSRAPSTPSKRRSVDPFASSAAGGGGSGSYQVLGREGVAPSYSVPRDILADDYDSPPAELADAPPLVQSCDVVASSIKGFGPFFNGLGDNPRATLEYPAPGQSEEYLLLVPRDRDEYDPLLELLMAVKTIVSNYLTPEQQKLFGSLDSLEISSNAGMILPGGAGGTAAMAATRARLEGANGTARARSADLIDSGVGKAERRDDLDPAAPGRHADDEERAHGHGAETPRTPRNDDSPGPDPERKVPNGHSHTAPVSPSASASSSSLPHRNGTTHANGSGHASLSPVKAAILGNAALMPGLDSPVAAPASPPSSQASTAASVTTAATTTGAATDPDPILRSFAKARNRRDGPLFLRTLARFNAELVRLRASGALSRNIAAMGRKAGVPEGVWRLVQDQVYARTVGPRVEELGRYQAFSDNVYGELLPRFMSEIAQLTRLGPGKVFVDLGSGVGNLLIQTSLQTGAEAYGCEMMAVPAGLAERQIQEAQRRWRLWGLKGGDRVEAWKGDFGEHEGVRDVLRRADVVLVNNYAFLPKTNENLSLLFLDLPDGAQVVSLKPFVPLDFRLTERTLSSPLAILRVIERTYTSGCVSWADGGGKYYIHIVDRHLIRDWLHRNGGMGKGVERRRWKKRNDEDEDEDDEDEE
ncbi:uncharacterized protein PFL1_05108 [Pseudozyma flocculosa PF-1]|uniref:Histone-lysine N-methyltransferase, H3 lysine-79 specific n=2 Tax=Pseudozyma flocculosa TaxID=84751 RepID=A0A5C3F768_9BASI|nr:uncharacterized protein PFL1_05108 [Pseudozyma flocculosa PF-1]EPQ27185.1 hypothetical protein PFL1_05108 [Pseudozyma flocculosa PF-1]SPO39547.1 related to protein-lysine N-methyltransferase [Pseudozyma flocculosa]